MVFAFLSSIMKSLMCMSDISIIKYIITFTYGFKFCLVSPELQGENEKLEECRNFLNTENIIFDAICTKDHNINRWQQI
jgi:hypothetical protein